MSDANGQNGATKADPGYKGISLLTLAALGVVFGDIGTSPLYALRQCFHGAYEIPVTEANILGVLSLIFWALVLVICVEYMTFVTRATNRGEGGILALMVLATSTMAPTGTRRRFLFIAMGLFGAALLYGDGMITPSISVLSAVEGLRVATPRFENYIIPITVILLFVVFTSQRYGTARIGAVFGPVVLVWFIVLGLLGLRGIFAEPHVLLAINPFHAIRFFVENRLHGFVVLGAVFLAITGAESLYADMGHFGRRPIQLGWFVVAFPGLLLNYFGQGALLLSSPRAHENPFYHLVPSWALLPMVGLATLATIIASQAVISGAFSLTRQAVQLGYLPRLTIIHTSSEAIGQIYVPGVNRILLVATISLVIGFQTSTALAAAYGVAVTTTMVITTILMNIVVRRLWGWRPWVSALFTGPFLVINLSFFGAAMVKVPQGGWFPLVVAVVVFTVMTTWRRGRQILGERLSNQMLPLDVFVQSIRLSPPVRVPGTAVFMSGNPNGTPLVLLHNLKYNKVMHEKVIFLTVVTEEVAHIRDEDRVEIEDVADGMYRVLAHYGFMESPNVPHILELCRRKGLETRLREIAFFLSRERLIPTKKRGMAIWREKLFAFMSRNSTAATSFFGIPPNQVVELGVLIEL